MALRKQSWPSAQTLAAATFCDHPLLNDETSVRGKRIIWKTEVMSAFKNLFKHRRLCIFSTEVEQILEPGPDFSVPLSSVCSGDQLHPTALHSCTASCCKQEKCLWMKWAHQIWKPCQGHFTDICVVAANLCEVVPFQINVQHSGATAWFYKTAVLLIFLTILTRILCLFKFLTEI